MPLPDTRIVGLADPMTEILAVDPHDEAALRAWFEVEQAAIAHDRPDAFSRSWLALANSVRNESPYLRRVLLAALEDGATVGTAELELPLQDNRHLAEAAVHVHPEHRRRGLGGALHDAVEELRSAEGRTTVCGELLVPAGVEESAGMAFATSLGYASVHEEDHLVLPLPVDAGLVAALRRPADGYEIVTWGSRCPDEYVDAFCRMRNQMAADVPTGETDYAPPVLDVARLRIGEERTERGYHRIVAAARGLDDGTMAGYSMVYLARDDDEVLQDDTLVMPEHRGRRLGTLLKLATLEIVQRDHPDRRALHTWTDPENKAMYRTNEAFGYRAVERLHEMQREDPR